MNGIDIRQIEDPDLSTLCALLAEGFPLRTRKYWQKAITILARRPALEGYPRFGYVLEIDGNIEGVLLLLTSRINGEIRSNLSSWYVREQHRKFATFMFQRVIRIKGGVYLNLSPSKVALPIVEAFGFKPYTAGTFLLDARASIRQGNGAIRRLSLSHLDGQERRIVENHLDYGCRGFLLEDVTGLMVALYRIKRLKRFIPAAQFVYGNPTRLVTASGSLMRGLLRRGVPICLIDMPLDYEQMSKNCFLLDRGRRFAKGGIPPQPGDLLETEIALFGP